MSAVAARRSERSPPRATTCSPGRRALPAGAELDVRGAGYETFAELERYCRCVAGSIGRLSLGVFGCSDRERGSGLADDLGVALQIGNILRDVAEDAADGRIYLPQEDLDRF